MPGLEETGYLTSTTAMEVEAVPESLLVIGGGYVALEQAQLFARLGSKVTMLVRSRLASAEEPEASLALMGVFADEGIKVVRRATLSGVRTDPKTGQVVATAAVAGGEEEFRAARLLMATGRRPSPTPCTWKPSASGPGTGAKSSYTTPWLPQIRGSGLPETSPGTANSSTSPRPTGPGS
ncbi:mercuric reductase [Arthrobacter sp. Hiyo4]|nr:mercuric reductase [Arthrobacter sp. Hiyo4]